MTPKAGYFVIDRLAAGIGASIGLSHTKYQRSGGDDAYKQNSYGIGPFVRYYFLPVQKAGNAFLEVNDQYSTTKNTVVNYSTATNHTNAFSIAAGPVIFLSPTVGLEWSLGYEWDHNTGNPNPPPTRTFKTAIGFQVYLAGKRRKA
jgi:hypothetical protein